MYIEVSLKRDNKIIFKRYSKGERNFTGSKIDKQKKENINIDSS